MLAPPTITPVSAGVSTVGVVAVVAVVSVVTVVLLSVLVSPQAVKVTKAATTAKDKKVFFMLSEINCFNYLNDSYEIINILVLKKFLKIKCFLIYLFNHGI